MAYLRTTIGTWNIDVFSAEAEQSCARIRCAGIAVFQAQPGFVPYRLMRADARTTIAVAEWERRALGEAGAKAFRTWLKSSGVAEKLTLDTYAGEIVAAS